MNAKRTIFRRAVPTAVVLAVAYWLFADTIRHYTHGPVDLNVIRFSHFGTYQDYETWAEVLRAFETDHPGLRVKQEYVTGWYGMYDTKMRQQILSNTLPGAATRKHCCGSSVRPRPRPSSPGRNVPSPLCAPPHSSSPNVTTDG